MGWLLFLANVTVPAVAGLCVVWKTILRDELKDMKLIQG
jgi:hypothetical protein